MSLPSSSTVPVAVGWKPGEHVEERRLAGAVGAEEAEDLAGRDLEADVRQGGDAAEVHRDVADHQPVGDLRVRGRAVGDGQPVGVHDRRAGGAVPLEAATSRRVPSRSVAPSRNTERNTSGRSRSSAVGPWKRISPFSMK